MTQLFQPGFLLSLIALIAVAVLIAIGKIPSDVGTPIIVGIAGVHTGAAISK